MKLPEYRYRSSLIFGDSNWHSVLELSQIGLSELDPTSMYIGDRIIPSSFGTVTKVKAPWLWRYGFTSANGSNFSSTSTGSNGSTSVSNLGVGISNSTWYNISKGTTICEGYVTSGSDGSIRTSLTRAMFSSYNSWYFEPSITYPSSSSKRALVYRFLAEYIPDLPSDMYSISGNSITWNITHPVFILLQGKKCIPY